MGSHEKNLTGTEADIESFRRWFSDFQDKITQETYQLQEGEVAIEVVRKVRKHVEDVTGDPHHLALSFTSTGSPRTSPFFLMGRKEMRDRPEYKEVVMVNTWGRITISGQKLAVYDESVLLALLTLAKKSHSNFVNSSCAEFNDLMYGGRQYAVLARSIDRLSSASVLTELIQDDKRVAAKIRFPILSSAQTEPESGRVMVEVNPLFLVLYGEGLATKLDVEYRASLKSDLSKALYRFLVTHAPRKNDPPFNLIALAVALNMDMGLPINEIRRRIRNALKVLAVRGYIGGWSIDMYNDVFVR